MREAPLLPDDEADLDVVLLDDAAFSEGLRGVLADCLIAVRTISV